jgi:hypothetical protein
MLQCDDLIQAIRDMLAHLHGAGLLLPSSSSSHRVEAATGILSITGHYPVLIGLMLDTL